MKESTPLDFHFDDLPEGICVIEDNEKEKILLPIRLFYICTSVTAWRSSFRIPEECSGGWWNRRITGLFRRWD